MKRLLLTSAFVLALPLAVSAQQITIGTGQSSAQSANVSQSSAASFVAGVGPSFGLAASTNTSQGASGQASQATIGAGQGTSQTAGFNTTHSAGAATQLSLGTGSIGAATQVGSAQGANTGSAATQFFTFKFTP